MKKAIGMAVLGFIMIVALWGAMEMLLTQFDIPLFLTHIQHPVVIIGCGAAAIIQAVMTFRKEKLKAVKVTAGIVH